MGPGGVVARDPAADAQAGLGTGGVGAQIDILIFQAAPQALHENIVHAAAFAVHADPDAGSLQHAAVLRRSQQAMADRMGGMATFDRLHTEMSNGESIRLQAMGAPAYCAWMREPFYTTVALEPEELDRWAVIQEASAQLR